MLGFGIGIGLILGVPIGVLLASCLQAAGKAEREAELSELPEPLTPEQLRVAMEHVQAAVSVAYNQRLVDEYIARQAMQN